jgi:hypothetical protein
MSIEIKWTGRTGNSFFQYAYARLKSAETGIKLVTPWPHSEFLEATPFCEGRETEEVIEYSAHNVQDAKHYIGKRDVMRKFWIVPKVVQNFDDLVVHLRLTDYNLEWIRSVINPEWYDKLIRSQKYRRLYIVVEDHPSVKRYLSFFNRFKHKVVQASPKECFDFIKSFDKIICSNSTFCWWAAYLSEARTVFTHRPWLSDARRKAFLDNMEGAIQVDGGFYRDRYLEQFDWNEYWKYPERFRALK